MTNKASMQSIPFASLPPMGSPLDGGTFEGITTRKDGTHCAVILLPEQAKDLTWKKSITWAEKQGGELPSRAVAALLFANARDRLKPTLHWTSEEYDASYAWDCYFSHGYQIHDHKSYEGSAVAVRLIPLTN